MPRASDLLSDIERWLWQGEDVAVATVVAVRGSSPRPTGARLAVTRSGRMSGAVSAGCVESDVFRRALEVLDRGAPALVHFSVSDAPELDIGLSCGGSIDVLIEPVSKQSGSWQRLAAAIACDRPVVLVQAVEPAALRGAKALIFGDETAHDDACSADGITRVAGETEFPRELLAEVCEDAQALLAGAGGTVTLQRPFEGGVASVMLQAFAPAARLFVVGATEIGAALCKLAHQVGMSVTVIDPRGAFANSERFPDAREIACAWPEPALAGRTLDADSALVTLTHDPKIDLPALACALRSEAGYVGALGSRRTHEKRVAALRERGFGADEVARIHGPVGLDIGGSSAEEIALSILAEIVAARNGRDARAPRFVSGIVLAAGASTRMGRPKQLLDLGGKPLLQHVIDAACASALDEVVVVLGANAEQIRGALTVPEGARVRWIVNEGYDRGMSESLRRGLRALAPRATTVAILLGDQPYVRADLIDRTLAEHASVGKAATRPVFGGPGEKRTPGHPVVMERVLWPALRELRGDEGARRVLAACAEQLHEVRMIFPAPVDIDTPEDYERAAAAVPA